MMSVFSFLHKKEPVQPVQVQSEPQEIHHFDKSSFVQYLTFLAKKKGYAYPSNKYLSERFSVSDRTIRRWIEKLVSENRVRVEFFGRERRIYICPPDIRIDRDVRPTRTKCPSDVRLSGQNDRLYRDTEIFSSIELKPQAKFSEVKTEEWYNPFLEEEAVS